jgi:hypothetical protein
MSANKVPKKELLISRNCKHCLVDNETGQTAIDYIYIYFFKYNIYGLLYVDCMKYIKLTDEEEIMFFRTYHLRNY